MRVELLIALTVMNIIIWDVTPCSVIDIDQHFGESSPAFIFCPEYENGRFVQNVGIFLFLPDYVTSFIEDSVCCGLYIMKCKQKL